MERGRSLPPRTGVQDQDWTSGTIGVAKTGCADLGFSTMFLSKIRFGAKDVASGSM